MIAFSFKTWHGACATVLLPAAFVLAVLLGCRHQAQWDQDYQQLVHQGLDLEQRHCRLQADIDSLWDTTTVRLARALPADFPAVDRAIFLKARNADHIRMFMSFEHLDAGTRALVHDAGAYDLVLATRLRLLLEEKREYERTKNRFLCDVASKDGAASRMYSDRILAVATAGCR